MDNYGSESCYKGMGLSYWLRLIVVIDAGFRGGSTNPKQETNTWGYMIYSVKWRSSNRSVFRGIFVATRPRFAQIIPRIWGTICRNPTFWMVMPILGHMSQQPAHIEPCVASTSEHFWPVWATEGMVLGDASLLRTKTGGFADGDDREV